LASTVLRLYIKSPLTVASHHPSPLTYVDSMAAPSEIPTSPAEKSRLIDTPHSPNLNFDRLPLEPPRIMVSFYPYDLRPFPSSANIVRHDPLPRTRSLSLISNPSLPGFQSKRRSHSCPGHREQNDDPRLQVIYSGADRCLLGEHIEEPPASNYIPRYRRE
jgi:hypothetical protein